MNAIHEVDEWNFGLWVLLEQKLNYDCQTEKHIGCCEMINLGGLQESGEEDWMKGSLMTGVGGGSGKSWSWNCPKLDNFPSVRPYPGLAFPETASVSAEIAVRIL